MSAVDDIPIPPMMAHLDRDHRGYPIPVVVLRDENGRPHFTINDSVERLRLLIANCCPICGKKLNAGYWFIGGPRSAFDPGGIYADTPVHHQCMRYAMQVCPYLAVPNYSKRIDAKTFTSAKKTALFIDETAIPERPALFVCVLSRRRQIIHGGLHVRPVRPYSKIEYWRHGEQLDPREGKRLADEIVAAPRPPLRGPRFKRR